MGRFEEPPEPLSAEGLSRKARILAGLQGVLTRRRRIRRAANAAAVLLPVLLWILWPSRVPPSAPGPSASGTPYAFTRIVRTDPSTVSRLSASPVRSMAEIVRPSCDLEAYLIDDRTLSRLLAEAGKPSGVFRVRGRILLAMDLDDDACMK